DVIDSWVPELDTIYSIGHSLESSFSINSELSDVDRVMAQWSAGTYFHPLVAYESGKLIEDSNLWNHNDFAAFTQFQSLNVNDFPTLAEGASAISKSSVLMEEDIAIFKHNSVTLSSVQDYWKGKLGYQQFPVVVNAGTTSVFTSSGEVIDWDSRALQNSHLPYVKQQSNVALAMYRPDPTLPFFGYTDFAVSLHWKDADFDEIRNNGNWLLGRQDNGYVGVRRSCTTEINNMIACDNPEGQAWVFVVGDSAMYGSFDAFQSVIDSSQFQEEWYLDTVTDQWVYYASIDIDSINIDYAWNQDSASTGIFSQELNDKGFTVYPNPATDKVTVDLTAYANTGVAIKVVNAIGQEVFSGNKKLLTTPVFTINTEAWAKGIYLFTVSTEDSVMTERIVLK
ncbi:MAG: T9SS type A sorting domain-containing protein, partial [Bacteroidia bacterium]